MMTEAEGFLLIDKPSGMTSHDVVDAVRRLTGITRVGHAGTLDPFATGLLIVAVGRNATRELAHFIKQDKTYEATIGLGASSDTDDLTGKLTAVSDRIPSSEEIEPALNQFRGQITQMPPQYSALKLKGQPAYKLARAGKTAPLTARPVTVYELTLLKYAYPELEINCRVSSGTYIRALARDLGASLAVGGHLTALRRLTIGEYSLDRAVTLADLTLQTVAEQLITAVDFKYGLGVS